RLAPLLALVVGVALARVNRVKPPSPAELAAPVVPAINALRLRLVSLPEGRWRAVGMLVAATCLFGAFHLLVPAVDAAGGAAFYLLLNLLSLAVILVILGHFSALTVDDLGNLLAAGPLQTSPAGAPVGQVGLPGMGGQPLAREGGAGLPSGIDPLVAGFADPAGPRIIETLQPVVLRKMLAESVAAGQLDWLDAGLEGDVVIDRDLDRTVLAVPAHLRTAVEGMIALAIADSDDGALRVTARAGLEAPEDHLQLILTVSDEGRGTAEGDRAAAGPLAGRGDAAAEGGLAGIAPYRFLVEQMGGTLRSVSVPGVGTTARLELTLRHAAATPLPESAGA
ncbi:MAG: ATP-binding protein, partial [Pseudomonadota bacterium]